MSDFKTYGDDDDANTINQIPWQLVPYKPGMQTLTDATGSPDITIPAEQIFEIRFSTPKGRYAFSFRTVDGEPQIESVTLVALEAK